MKARSLPVAMLRIRPISKFSKSSGLQIAIAYLMVLAVFSVATHPTGNLAASWTKKCRAFIGTSFLLFFAVVIVSPSFFA